MTLGKNSHIYRKILIESFENVHAWTQKSPNFLKMAVFFLFVSTLKFILVDVAI